MKNEYCVNELMYKWITNNEQMKNYAIRFHLYPGIEAIKTLGGDSILLQINKNKSFFFTSKNQQLSVEKSIFLGGNKILNNFCITISGNLTNITKIINWKIIKSTN